MTKAILDLDKLQELCDKATDGTWFLEDDIICSDKRGPLLIIKSKFRDDDIRFILKSRIAMPLLIKRVRGLETIIEIERKNNDRLYRELRDWGMR